MKTAIIAGATGLVGEHLLKLLLNDEGYSRVKALTRKPLSVVHEKLEVIITDFEKLEEASSLLKANDVFCCLGTTMKKAGSKKAFWRVDHDYPLSLANISFRNGADQYFLVSALGANENSSFYYNEVKGKVEDAIGAVCFHSYHIFRPSLLLGRRNESRPGEDSAKTVYRLFDFLIPAKYKGIDAAKVANAMLHYAQKEIPGRHVHSSVELQRF